MSRVLTTNKRLTTNTETKKRKENRENTLIDQNDCQFSRGIFPLSTKTHTGPATNT